MHYACVKYMCMSVCIQCTEYMNAVLLFLMLRFSNLCNMRSFSYYILYTVICIIFSHRFSMLLLIPLLLLLLALIMKDTSGLKKRLFNNCFFLNKVLYRSSPMQFLFADYMQREYFEKT